MKIYNMKRYILFIFVFLTKVFPFTNHVFKLIFFQRMVIEMLFNSKIQLFFLEMNLHYVLKNYIIVYIIERTL
jgi:hypothetical protein